MDAALFSGTLPGEKYTAGQFKLFTNRGQASIWPLQGMRLLEPMLLDLVSCEARYEL